VPSPGTNPDQSYPSIYRIAVYFWILFGLAFMASMVSLASDFFKEAGKSVMFPVRKRIVRLRKGLKIRKRHFSNLLEYQQILYIKNYLCCAFV